MMTESDNTFPRFIIFDTCCFLESLDKRERIDLIRKLDTSFPNKKYDNLVVAPRNSLMHNKCIYPSEETTNNLISCVEEVLKYYHTSYY